MKRIFSVCTVSYTHLVEMYESDSDFHDQLKARAIYNKIACPIQVMLESTLQFQDVYKRQQHTQPQNLSKSEC